MFNSSKFFLTHKRNVHTFFPTKNRWKSSVFTNCKKSWGNEDYLTIFRSFDDLIDRSLKPNYCWANYLLFCLAISLLHVVVFILVFSNCYRQIIYYFGYLLEKNELQYKVERRWLPDSCELTHSFSARATNIATHRAITYFSTLYSIIYYCQPFWLYFHRVRSRSNHFWISILRIIQTDRKHHEKFLL